MCLTQYEEPPELPVRSQLQQVVFIVGDASGTGFGSCCWIQDIEHVRVEFGRWTSEVELDESSNFREAVNLVVRIMRMVRTGHIPRGSEVFVFTDNFVMEATYMRGSSKSSKLHDYIVELRKLEMEGNFIIHFIWIAGKRMIQQGTDALSRGKVSTGSMSSEKFLCVIAIE